jgi:hypothetical protein
MGLRAAHRSRVGVCLPRRHDDAVLVGSDPDTTGQVVNAGDRALKAVHPMAAADHGDGRPPRLSRAGRQLSPQRVRTSRHARQRLGVLRDAPRSVSERTRADPGDLGTQESYDVRGGGWSNEPADLRCAVRNADPPKFGHSNLGFRSRSIASRGRLLLQRPGSEDGHGPPSPEGNTTSIPRERGSRTPVHLFDDTPVGS